MSNTTTIYPIITALVKAEDILGPQRSWSAVNQTQTRFIQEFFAPCREESRSISEIESLASFSADEMNRFLHEHGFTIQLAPLRPQEFGVASILDLLVEWLKPGNEISLKGRGTQMYPAVQQGSEVSSFYQSDRHGYPIAQLKTTSSDQVYLTKLDTALADFELQRYAHTLSNSLKPISDYGGVVFPMVDLKQEVDIKWLLDLWTTTALHEPARVSQALQETHLSMNERGARAKSAVALGIATASFRLPKPDLLIDGPFLIWFQRPGLTEPLFVGYITEEDWKKPETL